MNNYVLIGFMGCGKTTIGRELAGKTGMKQLDTDALIVQRAGMPVAEIFHKEGEQGFRRRETELLKELTSDRRENVIYSTGGGIVRWAAMWIPFCSSSPAYFTSFLERTLGRMLSPVRASSSSHSSVAVPSKLCRPFRK